MNAFDDTGIFFLSDNGADATVMIRGDGHDPSAAPGSAKSFLCIGPGWASASNTPFRRHKIWVSEGGISTPLIVQWPKGIQARGELRHDMGHVIDFVPTLLQLAGGRFTNEWHGANAPDLPGESLVPEFATDHRLKTQELFFNHEGNHSLRQGDWKLVSAREDQDEWQLFDLSKDRCEKVNLAAKESKRVQQMKARWAELDKKFKKQSGYSEDAKPAKKRKS
jgi:arylsulfatase